MRMRRPFDISYTKDRNSRIQGIHFAKRCDLINDHGIIDTSP